MEKASVKPKNKILKFLPKAAQAAAVSFQNLPFSPGRDKVNANCRYRNHYNKGFSGPILSSMIPPEARRKSKNFETQEPTSPKVSCMGQIKHKKKISRKKHVSLPKEFEPVSSPKPDKINKTKTRPVALPADMKKKPSGIRKIFGSGRRKSDASVSYSSNPPPLSDRAPSLGQMRKFASSRDAFANFDWSTAQIAPEDQNHRNIYSDEDEEREYSDGEDDVIIPFSAPILMAGAGFGGGGGGGLALEPRKEINLWKRRTMAQPKPLNLNKIRAN